MSSSPSRATITYTSMSSGDDVPSWEYLASSANGLDPVEAQPLPTSEDLSKEEEEELSALADSLPAGLNIDLPSEVEEDKRFKIGESLAAAATRQPEFTLAREDLEGDDLLLYDVEMEVMNMILLSIPNEIYNSVDACPSAKDMLKRVERLIRGTIQNKVDRETRFTNEFDQFVVEPREALVSDYNRFAQLMNDLEQNNMNFLTVTININNLRNWLMLQEEVVEGMNVPKETRNVPRTLRTPSSGNTSTVQCYNCSGKGHYARNYPKPKVRDSKYFMEKMLLEKQDEAGVIHTDEQNDFLFAEASRMEEIEEHSANICLIARIQPADHTSDDGPSYETTFISEGNVNSGSVKKDTHVPDLCAVEKLARNAYQEAEKQQIFAQQVQKPNTHLTSQLEIYKERVRILENINKDNNYLNEFLEADERAKHYNKQAQS
ncbi:integrase, catalytic region, zinc finger, CCHC-type containing protein [Tanacetum coccineum]